MERMIIKTTSERGIENEERKKEKEYETKRNRKQFNVKERNRINKIM